MQQQSSEMANSEKDEATRRMAKYKEERRKQLAQQIANRISVKNSSSDDDDEEKQKSKLYSKSRRRKKKETTPLKKSLSNTADESSDEDNLTSNLSVNSVNNENIFNASENNFKSKGDNTKSDFKCRSNYNEDKNGLGQGSINKNSSYLKKIPSASKLPATPLTNPEAFGSCSGGVGGEPQQRDDESTVGLTSPNMIKTVARTITPPVSPHHRRNNARPDADDSRKHEVNCDPPEHWPQHMRRSPIFKSGDDDKKQDKVKKDFERGRVDASGKSPEIDSVPDANSSVIAQSLSKPPIFPAIDKVQRKFEGCLLRRHKGSLEELNDGKKNKRKSVEFNPNEIAPPRSPRPHSAFLLDSNSPPALSFDQLSTFPNKISEFKAKFESLNLDKTKSFKPEKSKIDGNSLSDEEIDIEELDAIKKDAENFLNDKKYTSFNKSSDKTNENNFSTRQIQFSENNVGIFKSPISRLRSSSFSYQNSNQIDSPLLKTRSTENIQDQHKFRSPFKSIIKEKSSFSPDVEVHSILKRKPIGDNEIGCESRHPLPSEADSFPRSILKKRSLTDDELESDKPRSILKSRKSEENLYSNEKSPLAPRKSKVLMSPEVQEFGVNRTISLENKVIFREPEVKSSECRPMISNSSGSSPRSCLSPEPYFSDTHSGSSKPHGILKHTSSFSSDGYSELAQSKDLKPILKKKHSQEECERETYHPRSILKKKSFSTDDELEQEWPKSILKRKSDENLISISDTNYSRYTNSSNNLSSDYTGEDIDDVEDDSDEIVEDAALSYNDSIEPVAAIELNGSVNISASIDTEFERILAVSSPVVEPSVEFDNFLREEIGSPSKLLNDFTSGKYDSSNQHNHLKDAKNSDVVQNKFKSIERNAVEPCSNASLQMPSHDYEPVKITKKTEPNILLDENNFNRFSEIEEKNLDKESEQFLEEASELYENRNIINPHVIKIDSVDENMLRCRKEEDIENERTTLSEVTPHKSSIMDRVSCLQRSGNDDWKKRIKKYDANGLARQSASSATPAGGLNDRMCRLADAQMDWHRKIGNKDGTKVNLVDKLNQLSDAQTSWQRKVEEKDSKNYSVAGKMKKEEQVRSILDTETLTVTKSTPQFTFKLNQNVSVNLKPLKRPKKPTHAEDLCLSNAIRNDQGHSKRQVFVPSIDNQVESFFAPSAPKKSENFSPLGKVDFNAVTVEGSGLDHIKGKIRPKRSTNSSRNPMRTLAARTDIRNEYIEKVENGIIESLQVEMDKLTKRNAHLTAEAKAGLQSTEDFTQIKLNKSHNQPNEDSLPYKSNKMLIQIKGRRFCHARLVEARRGGVNSGDAFILVTPDVIYNWVGRFSNVVERAKSSELSLQIQQKREFGTKMNARVVLIEEEKSLGISKGEREFWSHLSGSESTPTPSGPPEEDETFEMAITQTYRVWELENNAFSPLGEEWGQMFTYSLLDASKILAFDFGTELYIWKGKNASKEDAGIGMKLLKELFEENYDYTESNINAIFPSGREVLCGRRPEWLICGRVVQNMETILFKDKFCDWPMAAKKAKKIEASIIKAKGFVFRDDNYYTNLDVESIDARRLAVEDTSEPDLILEDTHLGRGRGWYDVEERRRYECETLGIKVWHIQHSECRPLPDDWSPHFYSGDSYVVRWYYNVKVAVRSLKGGASKYDAVGRDRYAYFFWQGAECKVTEKGTSALATVELDAEKCPQIQVAQGAEPAAFLNLFNGKMIVHSGKSSDVGSKRMFLYTVRGELKGETALIELDCDSSQFNPFSSFIVVNLDDNFIYVWHGKFSEPHRRQLTEEYAAYLCKETPRGMHFERSKLTLKIEKQGQESDSLSKVANPRDFVKVDGRERPGETPRLFCFSSCTGSFEVAEVLCPFRRNDAVNTTPFVQSDLYETRQPSLAILDAGTHVWLWQGWHPEGDETTDGHALRWHAERRAAMRTLLEYVGIRHPDPSGRPPTSLVWAGHEPPEFRLRFVGWRVNEEVAEINAERAYGSADLEKVLTQLSREVYSYSELQGRPLPDGVDASKIESYLSNEEFHSILNMTKEQFYLLPRWKQTELKKEHALF